MIAIAWLERLWVPFVLEDGDEALLVRGSRLASPEKSGSYSTEEEQGHPLPKK